MNVQETTKTTYSIALADGGKPKLLACALAGTQMLCSALSAEPMSVPGFLCCLGMTIYGINFPCYLRLEKKSCVETHSSQQKNIETRSVGVITSQPGAINSAISESTISNNAISNQSSKSHVSEADQYNDYVQRTYIEPALGEGRLRHREKRSTPVDQERFSQYLHDRYGEGGSRPLTHVELKRHEDTRRYYGSDMS